MEFLSLPFVLHNGYLTRADLHDSIAHSIGLLLSTRLGQFAFDPEYGCDIWEREFSDIQTVNKSDFRASFRNVIAKYEKRLDNVAVAFSSMSEFSSHTTGIIAKVTGTYSDGNTKKRFEASYTVG